MFCSSETTGQVSHSTGGALARAVLWERWAARCSVLFAPSSIQLQTPAIGLMPTDYRSVVRLELAVQSRHAQEAGRSQLPLGLIENPQQFLIFDMG